MIKEKLRTVTCFCFGLLFLASFCFAEEIESFNSRIIVNEDSSLNITETIVYDFGDEQKHGIYRYFKGENNDPVISDVSVIDEDGDPYKYNFNNNKVKIGDEFITVWGKRTYIINYKIKEAINYLKDYDELYLNINGFDWQIPIHKIRAEVIIPKNLENNSLFFESYYGTQGSKNTGISLANFDLNTTNIIYETNSLSEGENFTILARFPKEIVKKPSIINIENFFIFFPVIVFVSMFFIWLKYGRAPKGRGTIIPEYSAINNLSPIEIGTLVDEKLDNIDISAEIIYLATKGYLTITQIKKKGFFKNEMDYNLKKLEKDESDLNDFDKDILDFLFKDGDDVLLSKLDKTNIASFILRIREKVSDKLLENGYFFKNKFINNITTVILLGVFSMIVFFVMNYFVIAFSFLISLFIVTLFLIKFSKLTQKGVEARENIQGFKLYLSVAEKDRINFHNAPEKNPKTFEKLLPYAMVLGVEKEWAKQFEGMYVDSNWYVQADGLPATSSIVFMGSLADFSRLTNSQFNSSISSSHSGFSSSGFSGGGASGGGGGSW
ncbi:MAG TPA: DUF2207 domain-containing protein [Candidatus Pacearchaeota archaeon]|nr:DUF2207 domain-containing protein [Candidatus Pacearchaeota archaeon]